MLAYCVIISSISENQSIYGADIRALKMRACETENIFGMKRGHFMDDIKREKYYELLEKISDYTSRANNFDREKFIELLPEFCIMFRLAKGVTEFYTNPRLEQEGKGEILVDFDNGKGEVVVLRNRVVTPAYAVIIGTIYMAKDEEPLDDEELEKVDIVLRMVLSLVARNRLQNTMYKFAYYDDDNYPNIRYFMQNIERLNQINNLKGYVAACFNLKHFSIINQDIGKENGDVVLRNYFNLLNEAVGDNGIVCRMGGDNFVMLFENEISDHIFKLLSGAPVSCDEASGNTKRVIVSARVGAFIIPDDFELSNPGRIMERIYPALQMAKQMDISPVFYDKKLSSGRERVMQVRKKFAEAIASDEIHAYYQPKVNVFTGEIEGAEALCRWISDGKTVMPMEFIPVLEMNMDICKLDFHMLELACRDIRRWLDEGKKVVRISVNFSRKHLIDVDLTTHILEIIDRYNVPHDYIEIELTETTTDVEFKDLKRIVKSLQQEGIYTSVDDFGNGYSSINLIRSIPWDVLKVDRSLLPVEDDDETDTTEKIYKSVVSMAHDIGINCITEGVETMKQIEILRNNNCNIAQGFFFDRPLPVDEFEKRFEDSKYIDLLNR